MPSIIRFLWEIRERKRAVKFSRRRDNVVICCTPCNQRKGGRTPEQADMRLRSPRSRRASRRRSGRGAPAA